MRAAVLLAVAAFSAAAAVPPCPEVTAEPAEHGSLVRIRHSNGQPLVAFLVEIVDYPGSRFTYVDADVRPALEAGREKRFVVGSLMPGTVPDYLKVTAAIYRDDAACGSAGKVKQLQQARRGKTGAR